MLSLAASKVPAVPGVADKITPGILPTGTRSCVLFRTPALALDCPVSDITGADGVEAVDEPIEPDDPDPGDPDDPDAPAPPPGIIACDEPCEGPLTDITITTTGNSLPSFSTA